MIKKYQYEKHIEEYIAKMVSIYEKDYIVDNTIPYCHSDVCPRCQKKFIRKSDKLSGVGMINALVMEEAVPAPLAIIYCMCETCTNEYQEIRNDEDFVDPKLKEIESFVVKKLSLPLNEELFKREKRKVSYKTENNLLKRASFYRKKGYKIERILLDVYNESCMICDKKFIYEKKQVKNIEGINFYSDPIKKVAYAYGICGDCKEEVESKLNSKQKKAIESVHILLDRTENKIKKIVYK